jgi:peptidoglycan biosynthesis protein MviN/MurJ (putative lipid II flippase)
METCRSVAATPTSALRLLGNCPADGLDLPLRRHGVGALQVYCYLFGASAATDAYNAAFQLPDMIAYFLVGGTASITFIAILSRYRESGDEAEGERALSVILTVMVCVLLVAAVLGTTFAPLYVRIFMPRFTSEQAALCTQMTRIMLPQPIFFFVGGVFGSALLVRKVFTFQAVSPLIYNVAIILGGVLLAKSMGVSSLAVGVVAGAFLSYAGMGELTDVHRFTPEWKASERLRRVEFLTGYRVGGFLGSGGGLGRAMEETLPSHVSRLIPRYRVATRIRPAPH